MSESPMNIAANPLTRVQFEVPFDRIAAEHVVPAAEALIADAQAAIDAVSNLKGERTYANTLGALETATERLEYAMGIVGHLESVATTPALREAYNAAQPHVSAFYSRIPLNAGLYAAIKAFAATAEAKALTGAKKRFLTKTMDDFKRHGAELDDVGKTRMSEIDVALSTLTTKFSQNVLDATNAYELILPDDSKLAGLPESAKTAAAESAKAKGKSGYRFTLQAPSLLPLLTYLDDAGIREQVWRAYNTRASSGAHDNRGVMAEILKLRREKATLLGYQDFSDFVLADRMAKRGDTAQSFVEKLRRDTEPFFQRENDALRAFRRGQDGTDALSPWDMGYWAEKQRKSLYDFDEEELRPYFAADRVLEGAFQTVQRLYGVRIEAEKLPIWHPEVSTYRLVDADGAHLGSFYVDLFPRESKRGGAWMNALVTGAPTPHLGLFCGNMSPAVGDTPALLTHREVETVFHEFGHLMHHLLSKVTVRSLAGTNVAWDFVELPSQIMENWCWERSALDDFARHYKTNETIPDALFEKLVRARTYRAANAQMRQISFALVDLALHREYDPAVHGDVVEYARKTGEQVSPVPLPKDYAMILGFSHLFADAVGYAAGYYSYKWAEVLDADAFSRFKKEGVFNTDVGTEFRNKVLSRGNEADAADLFRDFMGREPSSQALMERQGLVR